MNDHRAKPGDLCMSDAMPWCQHFEYRTDLPLKDITHDKFFLPVRDNLRDGDAITLCRFAKVDKGTQEKLLEVVEVRVLKCEHEGVKLGQRGKIETFDHGDTAAAKPPKAPVEKYIPADGEVRWNPGKKEHEVFADGKAVFSSADKAEAQAVARGDKALEAA